MPKVSYEVIQAVESALEEYKQEVSGRALRPSTRATYLLHATNFVRWLKDEFDPGSRL